MASPGRAPLPDGDGCLFIGDGAEANREKIVQAMGERAVFAQAGEMNLRAANAALIAGENEAYFAAALDVPVRSTVGAGDSMVAGLVHGFALGGGAEAALRWGAACGNASVMTEGTRLIDTDAMPALLEQTVCERI